MFLRSLLSIVLVSFLSACTSRTVIPTEFPTPEPPPAATPVPAIVLKRDAELEKQFASIAEAARGKVGAAAVMLETGDAALLNADGHYPMQSVYKLPVSMAMMDSIRRGQHDLDEKVGVTSADYVRQGQASEIRDKFPNGGEFTIRDLIGYALVQSDGSASDVLLRVLGGPQVVQEYVEEIGIQGMNIVNTEKELGAKWETQYDDWATPLAAIDVLKHLFRSTGYANGLDAKNDGQNGAEIVISEMYSCATGPHRIKGLLPNDAVLAHKTGTGGTQNGVTSATNDIGIIDLPNGKHLAVAVFVSDSPADDKTRDAAIAKIAKAAYDKWSK